MKKGFTIIEVLIYIAIATMLLFSLSSFIISVIDLRERAKVVGEIEQQGARIMDTITYSLRKADLINSPTPGNFSDNLSLIMTDPTKNPTVFNLSGQTLQITQGFTSPENLNNDSILVENLRFNNLSYPDTPGVVQIQFTLKYNYLNSRSVIDYQKTFQSSASLR